MSNLIHDSSNKKKPLGRGLGSLLGDKPTSGMQAGQAAQSAAPVTTQASQMQIPPESRVWNIGIDKLRPSAYQPRNHFEKSKLEELAQSIKANGILQPIVARKLQNGSFEIIAGERRWRAAQMASLHDVPVILKNYTDRETLELAIIENIQREDLNPIEEAEGYQRLASEFSLTQQQVAEKVGKDRATVANALRLLALPPEIREMLVRSEITVGHSKVLLALPNTQDQIRWARKVRDENLSVRKLEKEVQQILVPDPKKNKPTELMSGNVTDKLVAGLSDELQKILGTKVSIDYAQSKGKISIHFYSDEELSDLIEKLREGCRKSSISLQAKRPQST